MHKQEIIIISGATCTGKTSLAVEMAHKLNTEIISCDSRQVYKYLNVGTNKEGVFDGSLRKIDGICQHLTDIINPDEKYSVSDFAESSAKIIYKLLSEGKVPIIAGGTGLYIKALLYGLDQMPKADESLRKSLSNFSSTELYEKLLKCDPDSAYKNKDNPQRLLRALEVNILTGKTMAEHFTVKQAKYQFKHFVLNVQRDILYERINARCKNMLESGMISETQEVLSEGYDKHCFGLSGIGYKHIVQYLNNDITKDDLIYKFCLDTRHYAKRQNTWFNAQPDITLLNATTPNYLFCNDILPSLNA